MTVSPSTTRRASFAAPSAVQPRRVLLWLAIVVGLPLIAGCSAADGTRVFDASPRVIAPPVAEATPRPSDLAKPPAPGTVELSSGVFTDVLELKNARLTTGTSPEVTAELGSLVDRAPLLQLEVQALFYDGGGRYLGSGSYVEEGKGESAVPESPGPTAFGTLPVRIRPASPFSVDAASAVLKVIQFVTE